MKTFLIFLILNSFISLFGFEEYEDEYGIEINGDEIMAKRIADQYNLTLVHHLKDLGSVFEMRTKRSNKKKREIIDHVSLIKKHPYVVNVIKQERLEREKRGFLNYKYNYKKFNYIYNNNNNNDNINNNNERYLNYLKKLMKRIHNNSSSSSYSSSSSSSSSSTSSSSSSSSSSYSSTSLSFNDPMFPFQWYLINNGKKNHNYKCDLDVLPVWKEGFTGKGIIVSIIDDGIDWNNKDIQDNYEKKASYDFNNNDPDPMPNTDDLSNAHGTKCAGEVVAKANNNFCGVGVAFNAKIGGLKILDGRITDIMESKSLLFSNQIIDIYSASWGPKDNGKTMEGPLKYVSRALYEGARKGRGGKGSIFVWATGNGGSNKDDCSCDGYVGSIYTLSIGSLSENGVFPDYGESCPSTMAVVYNGANTFYKENYNIITSSFHDGCITDFKGTSSAAPLAAGCIALILEANNQLTWRDIQHIIAETSLIPNPILNDWIFNGAGYHVNNKLGFGVMNCNRMLKAAKHWISVPKQQVCEVKFKGQPRIIKQDEIIIMKINSNKCMEKIDYLEHVLVSLEMEHKRRGSVSIKLFSPAGTISKMLKIRPLDEEKNGINFSFMTVRNWGEKVGGKWKLKVKDNIKIVAKDQIFNYPREIGKIINLKLIFYGIKGKLSNHDKWIGKDGKIINGKIVGTVMQEIENKIKNKNNSLENNNNNNNNNKENDKKNYEGKDEDEYFYEDNDYDHIYYGEEDEEKEDGDGKNEKKNIKNKKKYEGEIYSFI